MANRYIELKTHIVCDECGHKTSKADALELEFCVECETCLDIPDEWYEE